jgi:hypothetical protein
MRVSDDRGNGGATRLRPVLRLFSGIGEEGDEDTERAEIALPVASFHE